MILLTTPRLVIRRLREADFDDLFAITGDAEHMRYIDNNQPITAEATRQIIVDALANYERYGFDNFAIEEKGSGAFVGWCGLEYTIHAQPPDEAEIGYALKKLYWGRGYAGEAAVALLDYGFRQCGLKRIIGTVDPENIASSRILTAKLGMQFDRSGMDEFNLPTDFYSLDSETYFERVRHRS
jgi:RimJ/RimL family protein N-acetyltransferase